MATPHYWRKEASYYGALKRSKPSDPPGSALWLIENDEKRLDPEDYFDPGNRHYKHCFEALIGPTLWNQGTVGDIIESLLGLQFLINQQRVKIQNFPTRMVAFLHDWCLSVYRYHHSLAWGLSYKEVFARIKAESQHVQMFFCC